MSLCGSSIPLWQFLIVFLFGILLSVVLIRLFRIYGIILCVMILAAGGIILRIGLARHGC